MNVIAGIYIIATIPFTIIGIISVRYFIKGFIEAMKKDLSK